MVLLALLILLDMPLLVDDRDDMATGLELPATGFELPEFTVATSDVDDEDVHERFESANESSLGVCLSSDEASDDLGDDWDDEGNESWWSSWLCMWWW